ncbi:hypothetical protein ABVN80_14360 [Acinetobacter baumannii]
MQQLMGHSSILTTQKYFASDPELLRSITEKLTTKRITVLPCVCIVI